MIVPKGEPKRMWEFLNLSLFCLPVNAVAVVVAAAIVVVVVVVAVAVAVAVAVIVVEVVVILAVNRISVFLSISHQR